MAGDYQLDSTSLMETPQQIQIEVLGKNGQ